MKAVGIGQCAWDEIGLVERYPARDEKADLLRWTEQGGGPVATALVTLARLGCGAEFCGVVGDDAEGRKIRESLQSERVGTEGLLTRPGARSQLSFVAVEQGSGARTVFCRRPGNGSQDGGEAVELKPAELPSEVLDGARILLLDGVMTEVSLHAARAARAAGTPVLLDAGRLRPGMERLLPYVDLLIGSERFGRELGIPEGFPSLPERLAALGPSFIAMTYGAKGCIGFERRGSGWARLETPAFPVEVVDSNGAGDVFHGAFAFGELQGWSRERTLEFAAATAALKCRQLGGRAGIPTLEEVNEFLHEAGRREG